MFEVFWFYFRLQLRTVAKGMFFAIFVCGAIATLSPYLAFFGMMLMFSLGWPKTMLAPLINFHWMATLPISRLELMFSRAGLFVSGMFLNLVAAISCSIVVSIQAVKADRTVVESAGKLQSESIPDPVARTLPEPSFAIFGGHKLYVLTLLLIVIVLALLWMTVASRAVHSPGRGAQLSGNPWWHPDWHRRFFSWGLALGLPLILLATAKQGMRPYVGSFNFLLTIAWLSYTMGSLIAMHAKIPRDGTRQWLIWLTVSNYFLAGTAIAVSWSWSVMQRALDVLVS